jgi:hypothetical protein
MIGRSFSKNNFLEKAKRIYYPPFPSINFVSLSMDVIAKKKKTFLKYFDILQFFTMFKFFYTK